jgi:hypothetical protein
MFQTRAMQGSLDKKAGYKMSSFIKIKNYIFIPLFLPTYPAFKLIWRSRTKFDLLALNRLKAFSDQSLKSQNYKHDIISVTNPFSQTI